VPLAELCLATRADAVELTGWDRLQQAVFRPLGTGGLCTAVGLDLSNAGEWRETPEGWLEPSVQVAFYTDDPFPFSTRRRDEILAQTADYGAPGQARFHDVGTYIGMEIDGLARLNSAVEGHSPQRYIRPRTGQAPEPAPADFVALRLAQWVRALRFHQLVKRFLDREGLARRIPAIVGLYLVGPVVGAVYYTAASRESADAAETRMIAARDAEAAAWRAQRRRELEETADTMRDLRNAIRRTRFWPTGEGRRLRRLYEAQEAVVALANQLGPVPRPSWRIADDEEFERFLQRYYIDAFLH